MERLVWQQNRHQEVYGGLCLCAVWGGYICPVGLDILKFEQTSLFFIVLYVSIWGKLEFCFGGAKPTKANPVLPIFLRIFITSKLWWFPCTSCTPTSYTTESNKRSSTQQRFPTRLVLQPQCCVALRHLKREPNPRSSP